MAETQSFKEMLRVAQRKALRRTESAPPPRKSKHTPRELSARFPVSRFKHISFGLPHRAAPRDPRFQRYAGHFNQHLFDASYRFLDSYLQDEVAELQAALREEQDPDTRFSLQRTLNRKKEVQRRREDRSLLQAAKKQLRDEERLKVQRGKTPFFAKRRVVKMTAMKLRMEKLQAEGQLEHYEARKRKRSQHKQKDARRKMARLASDLP